ncbi:MAG: hypothetical protein MK086_00445 [Flavobacteriales bacterium]|nr:hypothetical protein [Flavobacteriales bacterium]
MSRAISTLFVVASIIAFSCENEPGEGGRASIQGRVFVHVIACEDTLDSSYGVDEEVYIIAGDDPSHFDRVRTGPDGTFWFPYLRKGKYEIYGLSEPTACDNPFGQLIPVSVFVEIEERKDEIVTSDIVITQRP